MSNVSPGVYSKIIDLSTYIQAVPSTIGCIMALTKKGKDNQFTFVGSRSELISGWGEPNIRDYGKNYGQGLYEAYNYLGESGALYFMRCLPDNAAFSNIRIDANLAPSDSTASVTITYCDSLNTMAEIQTSLAQAGTVYPLCMLYPIGRGEYYNQISIRLTEYSNPMVNGVYVLDIYEKQSDGDDVIIESFQVSFDPTAVDLSGDSIFISYILATYSSVLRCEMMVSDETYTSGYNLVSRIYDKDLGYVSVVKDVATASITDNKQNFLDWQSTAAPAVYMVVAKDGKGNSISGWVGSATGATFDSCEIYTERDLVARGWNGNTSIFDVPSGTITYEVKKSNTPISDPFISSTPVPFRNGSDGDLLTTSGDVDTTVATQLLAEGYGGTLTNPVTGDIEELITDTENIYFSMVFDAGYPASVKTAISTLVQTRRDCVAILDNGDNSSFNNAIATRENTNTFNNFYTALYECYNKVYDAFTGQDIWVSPVYHMSYLLPRNDNVAEIWYAAAGFNRAAIDTIKELRFNPKLGQRDQMYLKQLNPIVKFSNGYTVWGQLTSQSKPSALQDLNIVRLVLYCKRSIEQFARYFIFELNDAFTWTKFNGEVVSFLEQIKKKRGLYSYSVETSATDYEKKTKCFHSNITLYPTRVVERIELNFGIM
jgi:hypothetical protein